MGSAQAARHDASSRPRSAASSDINGSSDPDEKRIAAAQTPPPAGASRLSQERPQGPNNIWAADGFRLKNGKYCFPLTVSDLSSRFLLGVDAHPAISLEKTFRYFTTVFHSYGLPNRIRTDNGVSFASNALAWLSVWFIKLGIYLELIEPGKLQQNGVHERMHRTLKQEATIPPGSSLRSQHLPPTVPLFERVPQVKVLSRVGA